MSIFRRRFRGKMLKLFNIPFSLLGFRSVVAFSKADGRKGGWEMGWEETQKSFSGSEFSFYLKFKSLSPVWLLKL